MRRRRKLKAYVIPSLYVILVATIAIGGFMISKTMKSNKVDEGNNEYTYVSSVITTPDIAVINESNKMLKPYTDEKVTVGKSYYDYKAESKQQENSITNYYGSYIQNSGIDYTA